MDFQAIVRRAGRLDGLQADEAADAVIDVDDEIAGGEARRLGDEIFRALRLPCAGAPGARPGCPASLMTRRLGLEAGSMPRTASAICGAASAPAPAAGVATGEIEQPCSASTCAMRSREPSLHSAITTRLPAGLQGLDMLPDRGSNTLVSASFRSGRSCGRPRAGISMVSERGLPAPRTASDAPARRGRGVRAIRLRRDKAGPAAMACRARRRPDGRAPRARLVIIGDLRQALVRGVFRQRLDRDRRRRDNRTAYPSARETTAANAPCRGAAAFAHRLIEHVVGTRRAERRDIAGAKRRMVSVVSWNSAIGTRSSERNVLGRALGLGIEGLRIDSSVSPKKSSRTGIEPGGTDRECRRARVFAGLAHRRSAGIAVELEPLRRCRTIGNMLPGAAEAPAGRRFRAPAPAGRWR
jgi:hypothetical protein